MLGKQGQIDDATQCVEYKQRDKISENSEIFGRDKRDDGKHNATYYVTEKSLIFFAQRVENADCDRVDAHWNHQNASFGKVFASQGVVVQQACQVFATSRKNHKEKATDYARKFYCIADFILDLMSGRCDRFASDFGYEHYTERAYNAGRCEYEWHNHSASSAELGGSLGCGQIAFGGEQKRYGQRQKRGHKRTEYASDGEWSCRFDNFGDIERFANTPAIVEKTKRQYDNHNYVSQQHCHGIRIEFGEMKKARQQQNCRQHNFDYLFDQFGCGENEELFFAPKPTTNNRIQRGSDEHWRHYPKEFYTAFVGKKQRQNVGETYNCGDDCATYHHTQEQGGGEQRVGGGLVGE